MMTKDEALKMAIKALLYGTDHTAALKACKEALEQPKVPNFDATAYQKALKESGKKFKDKIEKAFAQILDNEINNPQQPAPSWQELSDDEILKAIAPRGTADSDWNVLKFCDDLITIGRAIGQAIKEKNHGQS